MTEATEHSMAKTKKLFNSKENLKEREREREEEGKRKKRQSMEWEKISANHISNKKLITQNIQRTYTTQQLKTIQINDDLDNIFPKIHTHNRILYSHKM